MKPKISESIQKYQFEDCLAAIKVSVFGNLLLAAFLLLFAAASPRVMYCLGTGLLFFVLYRYYDWKSAYTNLLLTLSYLVLLIFEFSYLGIPESLVNGNTVGGKGILLDLFLMCIPWVYTGLRFMFCLPLLRISIVQIAKKN